jgi:DNA-directed RNA polymerase subunit RPC12/RpoP
VHRTFRERLQYLAIFKCNACQAEAFAAHPYSYHQGPHCRCPRCGTYRLSRLKERDRIDRMQRGFFNLVKRLAGGRLVHCRICRLQFYDRRVLASEARASQQQMETVKDS